LLILASTIRLLYVCSTSPDAAIGSVDAWGYHRLALNLDEGNGFSLRRHVPFVPDSVRTPLYPAFLLLIRRILGSEPQRAAIVQVFVDELTLLLTWRLATRLGGRRAGRVATLSYALNPLLVRYTNELLTETLLSLLLTSCVYAFTRYIQSRQILLAESMPAHDNVTYARTGLGWLCTSAVFLGLAALCKPNVQFMPLIWLLVILVLNKHNWRRILVDSSTVVLTMTCILAPWIIRNDITFERPFLSTAFEGNVSRISAPATLASARGQYVAPWSSEWESLFGEIVAQAAAHYHWDKQWDALTALELDTYNHQVYLQARQVLFQHPFFWLKSHFQGLGRYLEPQTFRVCYARFSGKEWPPDVLQDAVIHVFREIGRGDWAKARELISQERWAKLTALQGTIWWGTLAGQVIGLFLTLRGLYKLRRQPATAIVLIAVISYVMWLPGPIAYERFRVPVMSLILTLIGISVSVTLPRC
jgi:4-amino-4-deoxy-L-arabinose transferase-like glycosyltransferase